MRGAATHMASRQAGLIGGASRETVHDTPAQGVTQSGGYVECSPRRNSRVSRPGRLPRRGRRLARAGSRTACPLWTGGCCAKGWDAPGVWHSALGDTATRRQTAPQGGVELEQWPQWQERSYVVARQTRHITTDFTVGSVCGQSVPRLPSWASLYWCQVTRGWVGIAWGGVGRGEAC